MVKNNQIDNDEINLIELMQTVWEGKWKIAVAVVISFIVAISYQSIQTKIFTAITEIKPTNSLEINKYFALNNINFNFQKITKSNLLNLYIDTLNDKSIFEDAMRKLNLLDASQYIDEQKYNEAIIKLASSVKILSPIINKKKEGNLEISYQSINFTHHDVQKWKNVLIYADELANQLVKKIMLEDYNSTLSFLKQNREFQLNDTQTKIENALKDYDRKSADRLQFLREQASIARKLEVAKNTIEAQTFSTKNSMVANIKTDTPFYLRGYEAIEKEIELIESRVDKQAFVGELLELEQKKRNLEQDKTIERIELAFQATPLANNKKFSATSTNHNTTKFEYKKNYLIVVAIVIGLIVGILYVLISNAFQSFRVFRKKTN